jgi:hypothetical protein
MKLIDQNHPFYQPLWRRLVIVGVTGGWAAFELLFGGEPLWMVLFGALFAYCAWSLLIAWKPPAT